MRGVVIGVVVGASLSIVAGCAPAPRTTGAVCATGSECAGGLCEDLGFGELGCTQACDFGAACPDPWVCGGEGFCIAGCEIGTTRGSGAALELCVAEVFVACSTLDPVASCAACTCAPFGGGVCIAGRGCVPPAPDGTSCTVAEECVSGVCYGDTHVCGAARADGEACAVGDDCVAGTCLSDGTCGAPRAMGGECLVDADCATRNCSTNGISTTPGVCFQALGSPCERADTTCQRCMGADALSSGRCGRDRCDPTNAPNCPSFGEHQYACEESVNPGEYYCYERCLPDETGDRRFHNCYDVFDTCSGGGSFCR